MTLDTNTGKPIDPTVGMRVYREFYNVKKDKDGKKMVVVHKTNGDGSNKRAVMTKDVKKNGNGNGNKGGNGGNGGKDKSGGREEKKHGGGATEQVLLTSHFDLRG